MIILIKVVIIAFVLGDLLMFLGELLMESTVKMNKWLRLPVLLLSYMMTCKEKCSPFWVGLILTGSLFLAAGTSLIIQLIYKIIKLYESRSKG